MDKEGFKKKFNIPKKKIWKWIWDTIKDPLTLLLFAFLWLCLASPAIFGVIAYWATGKEKWLILSGSWIAFTAPPLPLPVTPLSIAGAIGLRQVIRKAVAKRKAKKEEIGQSFKPKKVVVEPLQEKAIPPEKALVEIVDIYSTGEAIASDEHFISDDSYVVQIHNANVQEEINRENNESIEKSYNNDNVKLTEAQEGEETSFIKLNPKRVMSTIDENSGDENNSQESYIKLNPNMIQNTPFEEEEKQKIITVKLHNTDNLSLAHEEMLGEETNSEEKEAELNPEYTLNVNANTDEKFHVVTFQKIEEAKE